MSRWERAIGEGLRLGTDGREATEVAVAVEVLNCALDLGRPGYVLAADPRNTLSWRNRVSAGRAGDISES